MTDINFINLNVVDSTNSYAKSLIDLPQDKLTVVWARRQTSGRGRHEKTFFSDNVGGLWVSIITHVEDISAHFFHNRAISLAIFYALKNLCGNANIEIKIKWPNDIYIVGKKIAGILLENMPKNQNALIIGFGVNVNISAKDFPAELQNSATSLQIETGREHSTENLLNDILENYLKYRDDAKCHAQYVDYLYKKGCNAVINNREGVFVTVGVDGFLELETENGRERFSSGTLLFEDNDDEPK